MPTCNDIDECSNTDCGEGTCVNGVNDYTCECKAGYKVGASVGNKKCDTQVSKLHLHFLGDELTNDGWPNRFTD